MFRPGFSLCLVVSLCTTVSASRVLTTKLVSTDSAADAPHKCTVIWKYRDQVASASFGVSRCVTECIGTNNDFNPEAIFKQAFTYKQNGRECECYGPDGAVKLKFHGKCGKDAAAKCWHDYRSLATDTWEKQINVKTLVIEHHKEQYRLHQFDYKEIQCEVDGCGGKEDCFESKLPSILAGRSADVMHHIGNIIKQIGTGEIKHSALDKDMQNIIDQIGEADKLFYSLGAKDGPNDGADDGADDDVTVGMLKDAYEDKLAGTGISVDHMLQVAGMDPVNGLDQVITSEDFERFLKPSCPE